MLASLGSGPDSKCSKPVKVGCSCCNETLLARRSSLASFEDHQPAPRVSSGSASMCCSRCTGGSVTALGLQLSWQIRHAQTDFGGKTACASWPTIERRIPPRASRSVTRLRLSASFPSDSDQRGPLRGPAACLEEHSGASCWLKDSGHRAWRTANAGWSLHSKPSPGQAKCRQTETALPVDGVQSCRRPAPF